MYIILLLLLGLVFGSAISALVWRLHLKESWVKGRSKCLSCSHELSALDLVPVLSWLYLGGRCRYCRKPIGWQDLMVEGATGLLFTASVWLVNPIAFRGWFAMVLWLLILCVLIALAVTDIRWFVLPDKLTAAFTGLVLVYLASELAFGMSSKELWSSLLASAISVGVFWIISAVTRGRGMGGGDIKLVAGVGLLLGLQKTALALFIAFLSASIVGISLLSLKRYSRKDQIPFGPFIIGGTILAYLVGAHIINWYIHIAMLQA